MLALEIPGSQERIFFFFLFLRAVISLSFPPVSFSYLCVSLAGERAIDFFLLSDFLLHFLSWCLYCLFPHFHSVFVYLVLGLGRAGLGHLGNGSAPKISVAWFFWGVGGFERSSQIWHRQDRCYKGTNALVESSPISPQIIILAPIFGSIFSFQTHMFFSFRLPPPSTFEEGVLPRRHHIGNSLKSFPSFWLLHQKKNEIVGRTTTPVQRQPHSNSLTTVSRHSLQQATSLLCDRVGFFPALVSVSIATSTGMPG